MTVRSTKDIIGNLVFAAGGIALFAPLWVRLVGAIFVDQPTQNRVFGLFSICFVGGLLFFCGRSFMVFSLHARRILGDDHSLRIERMLAPTVIVTTEFRFRRVPRAVSSFYSPYYRRGHLYVSGLSTFYVADEDPQARNVAELLGFADVH